MKVGLPVVVVFLFIFPVIYLFLLLVIIPCVYWTVFICFPCPCGSFSVRLYGDCFLGLLLALAFSPAKRGGGGHLALDRHVPFW